MDKATVDRLAFFCLRIDIRACLALRAAAAYGESWVRSMSVKDAATGGADSVNKIDEYIDTYIHIQIQMWLCYYDQIVPEGMVRLPTLRFFKSCLLATESTYQVSEGVTDYWIS